MTLCAAALSSEHAHQVTLLSWFDKKYPHYAGFVFAIPNGGFRHKSVAAKLALEGVRSGVPDLFLPVANGAYHGLFIELKNEKGRATENQKKWIELLTRQGYRAVICKGWESAAKEIEDYLCD